MYFSFSINRVAWFSYIQVLNITGISKLEMYKFGIWYTALFQAQRCASTWFLFILWSFSNVYGGVKVLRPTF